MKRNVVFVAGSNAGRVRVGLCLSMSAALTLLACAWDDTSVAPARRVEQSLDPAQKPPPETPVPTFDPAGFELPELEEEWLAMVQNPLGFLDEIDLALCAVPRSIDPSDIDVDKSLFIHDRATLDWVDPEAERGEPADFSLRATLGQIAAQANDSSLEMDPVSADSLFTELWDTFNHEDDAVGDGAHCSDNDSTLNGFPLMCKPFVRLEGEQASDPKAMDGYWPIALVNRLDLAHEGWRNCGEHRIVYGRKNMSTPEIQGHGFIIFEAVLPNPKPGCRSGCRPVAEFWRGLANPALSTDERAEALHHFFYEGLEGFDPVVHVDHYTATGVPSGYGSSGSGQIRTNSNFSDPWTLREFRLATSCLFGPFGSECETSVLPAPVRVNPHSSLFGATTALALDFQDSFAATLGMLAGVEDGSCPGPGGVDINHFGYPVSHQFNHAESAADTNPSFGNFYVNGTSSAVIDAAIAGPEGCGIGEFPLLQRAQVLNCAGCHVPDRFKHHVGPVTLPSGATTTEWPDSLGFVHTHDFEVGGVHALSPALTDVFLPERQRFMAEEVLNKTECGCVPTFPFLPPDEMEVARPILDDVEKQFSGELEPLYQKLEKLFWQPETAKREQAIRKVRKSIAAIELKREKSLKVALRKAGIKLPPRELSREPHVLRLETEQRELEPRELRELRQRAVLGIIEAQTPRQTVTGSFSVH